MDVLQFLNGGKPAVAEVPVEGGVVHVRGMRPTQRAAFVSLMMQAARENSQVPDNVVAAWGICNADGSRPDKTPEELLTAFDEMDGVVITRIAQKVLDMSGFGKEPMETAEKNPKPAGAPPTAPPGTQSRNDRRQAAKRAGRVRRG